MTARASSVVATRQARTHAESLANPVAFWSQQARGIDWFTPPTATIEATSSAPGYRWFPGGKLNTCFNAIDRHVARGRARQPALIWDSAMVGAVKTFTYADMLAEVGAVANMLRARGVGVGTTVIVYMPLVPEAVFAMLACARLGATHSVVFGGFAAKELAKRVEDCKPRVILAATCGLEPNRVVRYKPLIDEALADCKHKPGSVIVLQRAQAPEPLSAARREFDWQSEIAKVRHLAVPEPVAVDSHHPLYLLYTSGSTGMPKGVVRDNGGHAVALTWAMENVFGVRPGEVMFTASDIGWAVGHSFLVYGPMLGGCTAVMYEGKPVGTPDAGAFWRLIAQHKVKTVFTAPTAIRAIKASSSWSYSREDPEGEFVAKIKMPTLRNVFVAGERSDPDTIKHFQQLLGVPIRDNFWQTETGWPVTATAAALHGEDGTAVRIGSAGYPVAGYDVRVLVRKASQSGGPIDHDAADADHDPRNYREAKPDESGNLVVKLPLPPGCFPTLWQNEAGYVKSYLAKFPGYYDLTDSGFIDADGHVYVMSRTDDVINTAGHRLSTGAIEEVVSTHRLVAECAVVGMGDKLKGEKPIGFVVLKHLHGAGAAETTGAGAAARVARELIELVRARIGAFACFDRVVVAGRLPKTRSGKILRRTLRAMVNGAQYAVPATIEDASVLPEIEAALRGPPQARL
ncbi:hypothetical protein HK105_205733 [Polyrhizophydium stewartii]|uniref:Propionyl-CoA synthetase n=1 Tax=Polyrhizophydium stewartii TaxID=2732419 RepID=A0ABR4N5I2_9FUNG